MTEARGWAARLLVAGQEVSQTPVIEFVVHATRYARCDTAEISLAVDRLALGGVAPWFDRQDVSGVDVRLQLRRTDTGAGVWETVFHGVAGGVSWQPEEARLVLTCRDYLSALVDLRIRDSWLNRTGAELVQAMAVAAGLSADIDFGTATAMAGQFWQIEHKRTALTGQHRFQTAFDLAFRMAQDAGCDLYTNGTVLTARPVLASDAAAAVVHDVSGGVMSRHLWRDLAAVRGVVVHVSSWDSRQRHRTNLYYDGSAFSTTAPETGVVHSFRVPGRRLDAVRSIARGKYARIVAHGTEARLRIPGRPGLMPRHFVTGAVDGASQWPTVLAVDEVVTRASVRGGVVQDLVLRDRIGGSGE